MKTEQLSGASSDNRARTKWWIFPSAEKAGGFQSRRMAMGWSALCPLVPPSMPPSTTNLSSLSSSSHPDPLRQPIYSASNATIQWICTALCSRWIYAEREAKADPCRWENSGLLGWLEPFLSLYNFSCVSWVEQGTGKLFLVELEVQVLADIGQILRGLGKLIKLEWWISKRYMSKVVFVTQIKSKTTFSHRGKDPKEFPLNRQTQNSSIGYPIALWIDPRGIALSSDWLSALWDNATLKPRPPRSHVFRVKTYLNWSFSRFGVGQKVGMGGSIDCTNRSFRYIGTD